MLETIQTLHTTLSTFSLHFSTILKARNVAMGRGDLVTAAVYSDVLNALQDRRYLVSSILERADAAIARTRLVVVNRKAAMEAMDAQASAGPS
jgi:hypothetical protein